MTGRRRLELAVDDPLASVEPPAPAPAPAPESKPARASQRPQTAPASPPELDPPAAPVQPGGEADVWRKWTAATRPASYRLPDELLAELDRRTHDLRIPVGMTVTAALLRLLDEPDDVILAAVDRAEDAQHQARRTARRRR